MSGTVCCGDFGNNIHEVGVFLAEFIKHFIEFPLDDPGGQ